jgi:LPS-assembly protein
MKNKSILFFLLICIYINITNIVSADDLKFDTKEIYISDKGNIIDATDGVAKSVKDSIEIKAKNFTYNKDLSTIDASGNVEAISSEDKIQIKAKKFRYNQILSTINASGNVQIKDLNQNILVESQNIFYNLKDKVIKSDNKSSIIDEMNNSFLMDSFIYTLKDSLVKIKKAKLVDYEKNVLEIDKAYINLESNKLIGKDISIDFNNISYQKDNEPRLKGNAVSADGNKTVIKDGIFTICKKRDNCPPWQISAQTITHDKEKKTIFYKDAWLKIYDKPVFYFPKFFHPDPSVKRQSGFLMPSFSDSSSLGTSINIPYYKVISDNKDLTMRPRFYSNEELLVQTEYREVNATADHIIDFSFAKDGEKSTKSHFFSKSKKKLNFNSFDESELKINLQQSPNDTYLKTYKLKSPIIENTSLLTSSLNINAYRDDLSFDAEFRVFEDLSKPDNDRYEFVYPTYNLSKTLEIDSRLDGIYSFNSSGHIKNHNTNIFEKVLINDLKFNSDAKFSEKGFKTNYNFLIKNVNTDSKNSKSYREKRDHKLASIFEFNSSYPLKKELDNFKNILKPMMSLKLSPYNSKNMKDDSTKIDINNIFSINRIGRNDAVEGGASLTYGAEFSKIDKFDKEVFSAKIANIFRAKENDKLSRNSSLGNKTSDIVGNLGFNPNDVLSIKYDYSLDENLNDKNYELLGSEIKINNFITSFEYLNENNGTDSTSYLTNKTTYNFNDSKSFLFETRENKETKFTEFYNLIYRYRNDCLIAAIEYNKDYYSDGDLKPEENIFFKLTIVPFGQTSSPNLKK